MVLSSIGKTDPEAIKMKNEMITLVVLMGFFFVNLPIYSVDAMHYGKIVNLNSVDGGFEGIQSGQFLGYAIAMVGDVNADGKQDFAISGGGAPIYLISGKSTGWSMNERVDTSSYASFVEQRADSSIISLTHAGDINGDGIDDLLLGIGGSYVGKDYAGMTYLLFGNKAGWKKNFNLSNSDASFVGENINDAAGSIVAGIGDVNGDGFNDFLISAPYHNSSAGKVYLILGKNEGWTKKADLINVNISFNGVAANDNAGISIAGIGDVNGDLLDDFLIGAHGKTYLFLGKSTGWKKNQSLSGADVIFTSVVPGDEAGTVIAGVKDVNGDGYDDFLISAPGFDNQRGRTYLIFGKPNGWVKNTKLWNSDASFVGENIVDSSGSAISGAGDVNGDGYDDFIIGAVLRDVGGFAAGSTYLILGKSTGWNQNTSLSNADLILNGEHSGDFSGMYVTGGRDFNGDDYDDILTSAPYYNSNKGKTYFIIPDNSTAPNNPISLKAYSDLGYSKQIFYASINNTIYIELKATDENSSRANVATVKVQSNRSNPYGISLRLHETGVNTGIFRGNFTIKNRTHDGYRWLKATPNEIINITYPIGMIKASLFIGKFNLLPESHKQYALEDAFFKDNYWTIGWPASQWLVKSNATWLSWNSTNRTIYGKPSNDDVGQFWIDVSVTDGVEGVDHHNYTIIVNNTPPKILTKNVLSVFQDHQYSVNYTNTDDSPVKHIVTWQLKTNASWLSLNSTTGILSGKPTNADVGQWRVNITVDDGHGGKDWTEFVLEVINANDPPILRIIPVTTAYEDQEYSIRFNCTDIDVNDHMFDWNLHTDASWLNFDPAYGILNGTPTNYNVGKYYINITVTDPELATDFINYTLTVVNRSPNILTKNDLSIYEDQNYFVMYSCDDDESGLTTWRLRTNATWLEFNQTTNMLSGSPTNYDVGNYWVNMTVYDGHNGTNWTYFLLTVININDPIKIVSNPPLNAQVDFGYYYNITILDEDKGEIHTYILKTKPDGMQIDLSRGKITWVPILGQEGNIAVIVTVLDGNYSIEQTFSITVLPHINIFVNYPKDGQQIEGSLLICGTAVGPKNMSVWMSIDNSSWFQVNGTSIWSYNFDSRLYSNGIHSIYVKGKFGSTESESMKINININNKPKIKPHNNVLATIITSGIVSLIVIIIVIVLLFLKRKKLRIELQNDENLVKRKD
jgi:hypothetical protein